jgi:hypothetical protein
MSASLLFEGKYYRYYRLNRIFSLFLLIPVAHLEALIVLSV